jgi:hypothetical protein
MNSAEACAGIRQMVAERGWTWNVLESAYYRLSPGFSFREKLVLYSELRQVVVDAEETKVNDAVLAREAQASPSYATA